MRSPGGPKPGRQLVGALVLALWPGVGSGAQNYSFKTYTQESGLANVAMNSIAQDAAGYIWAGTQAGLYRYDGSRFRQIGDRSNMASLDVQAVAAAPDGSLWAGTRSGLTLVHGERVEAIHTSVPFEILGESSLAVDGAGRLYAASAAGLLRLEHDARGGFHENWISRQPSSGVQIQADGSVWFGCAQDVCRMEASGVVTAQSSRARIASVILFDQTGEFFSDY